MLRFLFPRLTAASTDGGKLYAAATIEARKADWYVRGEVPDTLNGRFALLSTVIALVMLRLEVLGEDRTSVALTERFVEVMEAEHRELGLGDPALGRRVRKLVGALSRRVDLWRSAASTGEWIEATRESVYGDARVSEAAVTHSADGLRDLWARLRDSGAEDLAEGRLE
jgi:cytochrome b pre-mRNA-processing protein 3